MEQKRKIALVTGGSRGLGRNMALKLAAKGIDIVLTYHSNENEARKVVSEIENIGSNAAVVQLDTGNIKGLPEFVKQLRVVLQRVFKADKFDYLINNAGIGRNAPIAITEEEMFDELANIHLKGVFFLTQQTIGLLNDGGAIVNVSTGLTRFSMPGYAAYASMKGGVEVFTRYLATELGARGIRANSVAPGAIATDFAGGIVRDNEQVNAHVGSLTALGRAGLPEDIGGVVAFLCTDDARWINAQRIEISGGIHI